MDHTSAPWTFNEWTGGVYGPDKHTLCQVRDETPDRAYAANARLIAAAPDLLECLRWYVENDDVNEGAQGNEFYTDGLNRARAAIEKATDGGKCGD